jgi:hypothetical protein
MLPSLASLHGFAQSPTNPQAVTAVPAQRFKVGDPEVSGAFMRPYKSQWREWEIAADGTRRETTLYTDELRFETLEGREVIRNAQHNAAGQDGLVILLDRKTWPHCGPRTATIRTAASCEPCITTIEWR